VGRVCAWMAVAAMGEVSLLLADRAAAAAFEVCKSGVVECLLGAPGGSGGRTVRTAGVCAALSISLKP
jgi:hypothetical protein